MTLPQLFLTLIHALTTQPESHRVDQLLADLAATSAAQLHDTNAASLKLACLVVDNREPFLAADRLLRPYGFTLTAKPHGADAHLISLKRHTEPDADLTATVRPRAVTKGAQAA